MKRNFIVLLGLLALTGLVLASATAYAILNYGKAKEGNEYGLLIVATQLSQKPQTYITLPNPDTYIEQAISNPGQFVTVGNWDNTQIDDLIQANNTSNVEINTIYYRFDLASGDPPSVISSGFVSWIVSGWIMWACLSVVSAFVVRAWNKRSSK